MAKGKKVPEDEVSVRKKVFDAICKFPGLFPEELERVTKVRLEKLGGILLGFEKNNLVEIRLEEGKKQYFPVVSLGLEDQKVLSLLCERLYRALLALLLDAPHLTLDEIEKRLKVTKAKITPIIDEFFKLGVIILAKDSHKGNKTTFQVFEPEKIRRLLNVKDTSMFQD